MSDLRESLTAIVKEPDLSEHRAILERIRDKHPHTIQMIPNEPARVPVNAINCFGYALGLHRSARWNEIGKEWSRVNTRFMELLRDDGTLRSTDSQAADDLVLYSGKDIEHAGVYRGQRITSKWGVGWVYEHALWQVPSQYGNHRQFFSRPQLLAVEEAFFRYRKRVDVTHFRVRW